MFITVQKETFMNSSHLVLIMRASLVCPVMKKKEVLNILVLPSYIQILYIMFGCFCLFFQLVYNVWSSPCFMVIDFICLHVAYVTRMSISNDFLCVGKYFLLLIFRNSLRNLFQESNQFLANWVPNNSLIL